MIRHLSILLISLSIVACSTSTQPAPEYTMQTIEVKDPQCNEQDSLPCASINISFPVFTGTPACDKLNEGVTRLLLNDVSSAEQLVKDFFERYATYKQEEKKDIQGEQHQDSENDEEEFISADFPWQYGCGAWVNFINQYYISVQVVVSNPSVFTHLDSDTSYGTFDSQTGGRLMPQNVFSDTLEVKNLINEYFISDNKLDIGISLSDQGIYLPNDSLPLTDNFSLSQNSVIFGYKTSDFAQNIALYQYVTIPMDKIRPLLNNKPKYQG